MRGVPVELRPLVGPERVLDRQLVQPELAGELVELLLGGPAQVDPDHRVGLLEVVGDVGNREALGLERSLAIHPGQGSAHDPPPTGRNAGVVSRTIADRFDYAASTTPAWLRTGLTRRQLRGSADRVAQLDERERTPWSSQADLEHAVVVFDLQAMRVRENSRPMVRARGARADAIPAQAPLCHRPAAMPAQAAASSPDTADEWRPKVLAQGRSHRSQVSPLASLAPRPA